LKRRAQGGSLLSSDEISRDRDQWILAREITGLEFGPKVPPAESFSEAVPFADTDTVESIPAGLIVPSAASSTNLETCPDCSQQVSTRALTCPHCGCPLHSAPALTVANKFEISRKLVIICWLAGTVSAVLAALAAALFVVLVT
jgi:hypothetical protein